MAISMAVLIVPILAVLLIYRVVYGGEQPTVVDTSLAVSHARTAAAFPVSDPGRIADGWRPVSATFQRSEAGVALRIGYLTPKRAGVLLVESNIPVERLLRAELTGKSRPEGTLDVAGVTWQHYTSRPGEQALVLLQPDRTVIVVGGAHDDELRELAAAIR
jgi:hypothetical protein